MSKIIKPQENEDYIMPSRVGAKATGLLFASFALLCVAGISSFGIYLAARSFPTPHPVYHTVFVHTMFDYPDPISIRHGQPFDMCIETIPLDYVGRTILNGFLVYLSFEGWFIDPNFVYRYNSQPIIGNTQLFAKLVLI